MGPSTEREHFIPLRKCELVEMLCGDDRLTGPEAESFRRFCRLVSSLSHLECHQRLEKLKESYAPFDPDADTKALVRCRAEEGLKRLNELFRDFAWLMEQAQYKHLSSEDIEPALQGASEWGLLMDVDFRIFERLAIFARGDTLQRRVRRRLRTFWKTREIEVPIYQRVVMIMKLRPHRRLGKGIRTDCVYFQVFKNIPKLDIKMLLPGARARLPLWDRGKIGVSMGSSVGLALWHLLQTSVETVLGLPPLALFGLVSGTLGYGVRSYWAFQQTRQKLHLALTQVLFYQNLDTNAGVLYRLFDEAEEQQCREMILAWYCLWKHAGETGYVRKEWDEQVERYLEGQTHLRIAFEIESAVAALERAGVVEQHDGRYRALPPDEAVRRLEESCSNFIRPQEPLRLTPAAERGTGR